MVRSSPGHWYIAIGIRKNDNEWRDFLNAAMLDMWKDGQLKQFLTEFRLPYDPAFDPRSPRTDQ